MHSRKKNYQTGFDEVKTLSKRAKAAEKKSSKHHQSRYMKTRSMNAKETISQNRRNAMKKLPGQ